MLQNVKSSRNGVFWDLLRIFHTLHGCAGGYVGGIQGPKDSQNS